jgi:hypothetical protein
MRSLPDPKRACAPHGSDSCLSCWQGRARRARGFRNTARERCHAHRRANAGSRRRPIGLGRLDGQGRPCLERLRAARLVTRYRAVPRRTAATRPIPGVRRSTRLFRRAVIPRPHCRCSDSRRPDRRIAPPGERAGARGKRLQGGDRRWPGRTGTILQPRGV